MPADISVVIPSVNGLGDLTVCLDALAAERNRRPIEVVVADRVGDGLRAVVQRRFPFALVVAAPPHTTIPALRAMGIRAATSPAVAIIEDHVIVPPGWAAQLLEALAGGADVVGGLVENAATESVVDWAAFLCEYSAALPPLPAGESSWLVGNNVVYRREVLVRYLGLLDQGHWENRLHDAMRADGIALVCVPSITVGHRKHFTFAEYLSQRFLYSRSYAGMRIAGAPLPRRIVWGCAAVLLPPVLFYRTVARIMSKGGYTARLVPSLPLLVPFVLAWGAGEMVGYFLGPGDSLQRVR